MGHEVFIEFAQRFGGRFLIRRTNLARDLAAPQKIVGDYDAARAQPGQRQIEIAAIFFFHRIDENQIEDFMQARNDVKGVTFFDLHAVAHFCALEITFSGLNHLVAGIDGNNQAVVGHRARQVNHGIANRHPAFQDPPRTDRAGGDFQKARNLAIGINVSSGSLDLKADTVDLNGTLAPAYTVNSLLGRIPLLGDMLVGGEGQGVFAPFPARAVCAEATGDACPGLRPHG